MTRRGAVLFAAMSVIWGIPYLFIRVADRGLHPAVIVSGRTLIGALVLLPFAAHAKALRPVLPGVAVADRVRRDRDGRAVVPAHRRGAAPAQRAHRSARRGGPAGRRADRDGRRPRGPAHRRAGRRPGCRAARRRGPAGRRSRPAGRRGVAGGRGPAGGRLLRDGSGDRGPPAGRPARHRRERGVPVDRRGAVPGARDPPVARPRPAGVRGLVGRRARPGLHRAGVRALLRPHRRDRAVPGDRHHVPQPGRRPGPGRRRPRRAADARDVRRLPAGAARVVPGHPRAATRAGR